MDDHPNFGHFLPIGLFLIGVVKGRYKTSEWINETTPIKVKSHGRKAQSIFRAGLDYLARILNHVDTWLEELFGAVALLFETRWEKAP